MSEDSNKKQIICWECEAVIDEIDAFIYDYASWNDEDVIEVPTPYYRKYCKTCYEKLKQVDDVERIEYIRLKKKNMFNRACRILEKQNAKMYEYQDSIKAVEEVVKEKPDKFDSSCQLPTV